MQQLTPEALETIAQSLPIQHISHSAIRQYLTNEGLFYKKYVRYEYDETGKPSMMIGKAVHYAIEQLHWGAKQEELHQIAYKNFSDGLAKLRLDACTRLEIKTMPILKPQEEYKNPDDWVNTQNQLAKIEANAVQWGKKDTTCENDCHQIIKICLDNFLASYDADSGIKVTGSEINQTVRFSDFEGNVQPIPLKGIMDAMEEQPDGTKGIREYKTVAKFTDSEIPNAAYELQGGALYFIYYGTTGEEPAYIEFEEILKKEPSYILPSDPNAKLLQADLKKLADDAGLIYDKYVKNDQLKDMLAIAGILKLEPGIRKIRYDYRSEAGLKMIQVFIEVYKRIMYRLIIQALYDIDMKPLPNPFDQMSGKEAWEDFTQTMEIDQKAKGKKPAKETDEDEIDIY